MHSSSTTFMLSPCAALFSCDAFYCAVVLVFARGLAQRRHAKKCFLSYSVQHGFRKLVFQKIESSWVFFLQSISGIGNKKSWSFSRAVGFVENKGKWTSELLFTGILVLVF